MNREEQKKLQELQIAGKDVLTKAFERITQDSNTLSETEILIKFAENSLKGIISERPSSLEDATACHDFVHMYMGRIADIISAIKTKKTISEVASPIYAMGGGVRKDKS